MNDITYLPAEYPDAILRNRRVFFLQLHAFEAVRVSEGNQPLALQAEDARTSAPMAQIAAAFDEVPVFQSDSVLCLDDLTFEDKARFVYLASQFNGQHKQTLYHAFVKHWAGGNARSEKGVQVRFMKDGVEDMVINM
jgi:hypothetical protein